MEPPKTPGRLGNSVPKAGSVCPGAWHLGVKSRGWWWGAAPGNRLIGLRIRGLYLREAGKESREHSYSSLFFCGESGTDGGLGVSGLGAGGKSSDSSDLWSSLWYRSKLAGDDRTWFSQKPKGEKSDNKEDCQMRFCGIHFPKCGKPCLAALNVIYSNPPHQAKGQHPSTAWRTEGRYLLPVSPILERK